MTTRQKLLIFTSVVLVGNIFIGFMVYQSNQKLRASQKGAKHSEQLILQLNHIESLSKDIRIASLEYIITEDTANLTPLYAAKTETFKHIKQIKTITSDNPIQNKLADSLDHYLKKRLDLLEQIIASKRKDGKSNDISKLTPLDIGIRSARIQQITEQIQTEEIKLLNTWEEANKSGFFVFNLSLAFQFILIVILSTLHLLTSRKYFLQLKEQDRRAAALLIANKELLYQNTEKEKRAAELVIANKELLFQNEEKEKRSAEIIFANAELTKEKAQKEFDRSNLYALINNTNDLMWSTNCDLQLITSNQPFDNAKLHSARGVIYKTSHVNSSSFSLDELEPFNKYYQRAFAGESFTEIKYSNTPTETWAEISFHPIRNGNEVVGTACHSRDITQRKKSELKLAEQHAELVKTNAELDRFVYSASHDLRSPLTSVLGLVSFIDSESKEPNILEYAGMIRNSITRLDKFIKNILSYSSNNRTEIDIEKIPVRQTVEEIINTLRNMPDAAGIDFEVHITEPIDFYSDFQRFSTVVENLIANAIKYHKKETKGRYIKIIGASEEPLLQLTISDNGIGIIPEYHEKIFDMFFRISSKKPGSGIGLYIVKEIIGRLQGTIEVESKEEVGTSFKLLLKNLKP